MKKIARRDVKRVYHRITMDRYDVASKRLVKRNGPQVKIRRWTGDGIKARIDQARLKADLTIQELELLAEEPGLYTKHILPDDYILGRTGGLQYAIEKRKKRIFAAVGRIAKVLGVSVRSLLKEHTPKGAE